MTPKHAYNQTQRSQSGLTMLARHRVGTYQENELTRNSFELAEPLWTDRGVKSGISVRELIST